MELNEIHWNKAVQEQRERERQQKIDKEAFDKEYKENVDNAHDQFWEALGSDDFRTSDFYDACSDWGIDEDDLLDRII